MGQRKNIFFIRTIFLTKNLQKDNKKQGISRFYTLFVLFLPQTITLSLYCESLKYVTIRLPNCWRMRYFLSSFTIGMLLYIYSVYLIGKRNVHSIFRIIHRSRKRSWTMYEPSSSRVTKSCSRCMAVAEVFWRNKVFYDKWIVLIYNSLFYYGFYVT